MCWMTIQRDEDGESAPRMAIEAIEYGQDQSGGHSWGIAFPSPFGDGLHLQHGVGRVPPRAVDYFARFDAEIALGHTRLATQGTVNMENAHPFPIVSDEGETVAALAHNGTWHDAPTTDRADSYYIARLVETLYRSGHDLPTAVAEAGDITSETLTVLTSDGRGLTYAGRYTICEATDAVKSTGGNPIPEGTLQVV